MKKSFISFYMNQSLIPLLWILALMPRPLMHGSAQDPIKALRDLIEDSAFLQRAKSFDPSKTEPDDEELDKAIKGKENALNKLTKRSDLDTQAVGQVLKEIQQLHGKNKKSPETELEEAIQKTQANTLGGDVSKLTIYNNNETILHRAAFLGYPPSFIEIILKYFPKKIDIGDKNGDSPLNLAIIASNKDGVRCLLEHRADPQTENNQGNTALHRAAEKSSLAIVKLLCDSKYISSQNLAILLAVANNQGRTPLHIASTSCERESNEILDFLIANKANVAAVDRNKLTPLHLAAQLGNKEKVIALLKAGADVHAKDKKGKIPADLAEANNKIEILSILNNGLPPVNKNKQAEKLQEKKEKKDNKIKTSTDTSKKDTSTSDFIDNNKGRILFFVALTACISAYLVKKRGLKKTSADISTFIKKKLGYKIRIPQGSDLLQEEVESLN